MDMEFLSKVVQDRILYPHVGFGNTEDSFRLNKCTDNF